MKTRNGFVSNSSSSSFVIITTQEKWKEATKKFADKHGNDVAEIVKSEFGRGDKAKVLGQDALIFSGVISTEEFGSDWMYNNKPDMDEDDACDLACKACEEWYDLLHILDEDGVSYTTTGDA